MDTSRSTVSVVCASVSARAVPAHQERHRTTRLPSEHTCEEHVLHVQKGEAAVAALAVLRDALRVVEGRMRAWLGGDVTHGRGRGGFGRLALLALGSVQRLQLLLGHVAACSNHRKSAAPRAIHRCELDDRRGCKGRLRSPSEQARCRGRVAVGHAHGDVSGLGAFAGPQITLDVPRANTPSRTSALRCSALETKPRKRQHSSSADRAPEATSRYLRTRAAMRVAPRPNTHAPTASGPTRPRCSMW
jgi:hypothetical protein